jgi:hypothetical protein
VFKYVHKDGREGTGWSTWAAIEAALGAEQAEALPLETRMGLRKLAWKKNRFRPSEYPEFTGAARWAPVRAELGRFLGVMLEMP